MADWMQLLCQAVSKGVSCSCLPLTWPPPGPGPFPKLTRVVGRPARAKMWESPKADPGREGWLGAWYSPAPELQLASPGPSANALQVIPQGVSPSPCIPCCLVITDDRLFTCHEDCQTSFFRSLGTAELADISAVCTEPGREYCVLVSGVAGSGAGPGEGALRPLTGAPPSPGVLPGQPAAPPTLGRVLELHV